MGAESKVDPDKSLDFRIQECLTRLGVSSAVDWDVLAFVCRHKASLANAEQIARLLGYPSTVVGDALDHLESLKLIRRSRASQGVRLYQFVASEAAPPSNDSFQQLISLTENRGGRLLLIKKLRQHRTGSWLAKKKGQDG
jgi:MarR family